MLAALVILGTRETVSVKLYNPPVTYDSLKHFITVNMRIEN